MLHTSGAEHGNLDFLTRFRAPSIDLKCRPDAGAGYRSKRRSDRDEQPAADTSWSNMAQIPQNGFANLV